MHKAYRLNPSCIETISWMGAYYVESQFCEKAVEYFQRAAVVQ
jgi:intraflagellar transport protein 88